MKPLLVTGSPRSGTTWLGRMLDASPQLHYVHEPFNPHSKAPELGRLRFKQHFTYIHPGNQLEFESDLARVIEGRFDLWNSARKVRSAKQLSRLWQQSSDTSQRRKAGVAVLMKDPIALMSADWLVQRFDMQCVVMIRHPAAFVASIDRLEWNSKPFRWALSQPELMASRLQPYVEELQELEQAEYDVIDQAAMAWKLHHHVIADYQARFPDWIFLHHEDMSIDPVDKFRTLYGRLGLDWTTAAEAVVLEHTGRQNPDRAAGKEKALRLDSAANVRAWRGVLSEAEIETIRLRVGSVFESFYDATDW